MSGFGWPSSWLNQFKCNSFIISALDHRENSSADTRMRMSFDGHLKMLSLEGLLIGTVTKLVVFPFSTRVEDTSMQGEQKRFILNEDLGTIRPLLTTFAADLTEKQRDDLCRATLRDQLGLGYGPTVSPIPDAGVQAIRAWLGLDIRKGFCKHEFRAELSEHTANNLRIRLQGESIFLLDSGHVGVTTSTPREGDYVAILYGGRQCFVLRPRGPEYRLQGSAYVQGVMRGESIRERDEDGRPLGSRMFNIC